MSRYIDADALTDKVDKYIYRITRASKRQLKARESAILADIKAHIELSPTIDAEPVRHGKWIFNPSDAFEAMFAKPKCSECGFESADGGNYCPHCGADMRGTEDGDK